MVQTLILLKIVNEEFDLALHKLESDNPICTEIRVIQLEEQQHRDSGKELAGNNYPLSGVVARITKLVRMQEVCGLVAMNGLTRS